MLLIHRVEQLLNPLLPVAVMPAIYRRRLFIKIPGRSGHSTGMKGWVAAGQLQAVTSTTVASNFISAVEYFIRAIPKWPVSGNIPINQDDNISILLYSGNCQNQF